MRQFRLPEPIRCREIQVSGSTYRPAPAGSARPGCRAAGPRCRDGIYRNAPTPAQRGRNGSAKTIAGSRPSARRAGRPCRRGGRRRTIRGTGGPPSSLTTRPPGEEVVAGPSGRLGRDRRARPAARAPCTQALLRRLHRRQHHAADLVVAAQEPVPDRRDLAARVASDRSLFRLGCAFLGPPARSHVGRGRSQDSNSPAGIRGHVQSDPPLVPTVRSP
jgi:hypothetical protein